MSADRACGNGQTEPAGSQERAVQAWRDLVCANIKKRRLALKLSQAEAGAAVGINMSHYGMIERGRHNAHLGTFLRIAIALDMDPSDLFAVSDETQAHASSALTETAATRLQYP